MNANRVYGLDILRTLAIVFVVFSHLSVLLFPQIGPELLTPIFGYLGVELFFVLSVFLIGTIIIKEFFEESTSSWKKLKIFWVRRWFRTLPTYYLVLIIDAVLSCVVFKNKLIPQFPFYFIFLQNLLSPHPIYFMIAWSLAIEEWFYFTFPIIVLVLTFSLKPANKSSTIIYTIILYQIVCLGLRIYFSNQTFSDEWDAGFKRVTLFRLDAISFGVLLAVLKMKFGELFYKFKRVSAVVGLIVLIAMCCLLIQKLEGNIDTPFFFKTIFFTLVSFSITLLFPFFDSIKSFSKNSIFEKLFTNISTYSYSIYLIHMLVKLTLMQVLSRLSIHNSMLQFYIILFATYFVAQLLYKWFEKPTTDLRNRFDK